MDPLDEKRNGYSLGDCAEVLAQMSALKTEHGEPGYLEPFHQFLRSKGLTENAWATVYNDWHTTMEADPALGAKFHTYLAQVQQRQLIAKQPNVSGEAMEGLSLEAYAKISAQIQTGAAVEGLVAGEGLSMEQWLKGQAAWGERMGSVSPTDPILVQFGQLYQKWSPNHQAAMEAATAKHLEDAANSSGRGDGMSEELTLDNAAKFFGSGDVRVRARGVREMIRIWELNWNDRDEPMRQLTRQAYDEAIAILTKGAGDDRPGILALEGPVDAMDIHAWSAVADQEEAQQGTSDLVYGPLKDLANEKFMTAAQSDAAQDALRQAIARLEPRAEAVNEAFGQATDELKRVQLRSLVDDYRETLEGLQEALDDWSHEGPEDEEEETDEAEDTPAFPAAERPRAVPPKKTAPISAPLQAADSGILGLLKSLPILGPILKMLGL